MDMTVDHARKQNLSAGVDDNIGRLIGQVGGDLVYPSVADKDIGGLTGTFVYEDGVGDQYRLHAGHLMESRPPLQRSVPLFCHDRQRDPGGQSKDEEHNFVKSQKAVKYNVDRILVQSEQSAIDAVYKASAPDTHPGRKRKQSEIDEHTPHKKFLQILNGHGSTPVLLRLLSSC
jgi:hypothetical protein